MSLLIDIAHLILATALSFLGLDYEREDEARAIQLNPAQVRTIAFSPELTPTTFAVSISVQTAQTYSAPIERVLPVLGAPEAAPAPQMVSLNDCETIQPAQTLPTL